MTLFELLALLRKRIKLVVLLPLITCAIVGAGSMFLPNEYTTSTTMYVLSRNNEDATESAVTQQDLSVGSMLTNDVSSILKSTRVRNDVAGQLGLENLNGYTLNVTNATGTRVITLTVTGHDQNMVAQVANALVADTSRVASEVMNIESVNVIDEAITPIGPSGPAARCTRPSASWQACLPPSAWWSSRICWIRASAVARTWKSWWASRSWDTSPRSIGGRRWLCSTLANSAKRASATWSTRPRRCLPTFASWT